MKVKKPEVALLLVTLIAAAGWIFSTYALREIPPYSFIALRFLLASCALALFSIRELRAITKKDVLRSALTGTVLGVALLFWVVGLHRTTSVGESAFIVSLTVLVVPLVGWLVFSKRITASIILGLVPAVAGLFLLTVDNGLKFEPGQWYFIVATFGFALHLNLSSHFVGHIPAVANTTTQMVVVGGIAAVAAAISETITFSYSGEAWGWLLASAVFATSFRFALQNYALRQASPSHASMILLAEPIWVAILGVLLLQESWSNSNLIGCALIFSAILLYRSKAVVNKPSNS